MANGRRILTPQQAEEALLRYYNGENVHDIISDYKVNPYRLYEVIRGTKHPHAQRVALTKLSRTHPERAKFIEGSKRFPLRPQIQISGQPDLFSDLKNSRGTPFRKKPKPK